jgi:hypothetical protein
MTSRQYQAIDERAAAEIQRLHKRHPRLGHHGLLEALRQADFDIDPNELKLFMKEHHIKPERPWRPFRLRGLPAWLGGLGGRDEGSP